MLSEKQSDEINKIIASGDVLNARPKLDAIITEIVEMERGQPPAEVGDEEVDKIADTELRRWCSSENILLGEMCRRTARAVRSLMLSQIAEAERRGIVEGFGAAKEKELKDIYHVGSVYPTPEDYLKMKEAR